MIQVSVFEFCVFYLDEYYCLLITVYLTFCLKHSFCTPFLVENLSQALVSGNEGFPLLSKILFIFLQILLQDRSTKVSLQ